MAVGKKDLTLLIAVLVVGLLLSTFLSGGIGFMGFLGLLITAIIGGFLYGWLHPGKENIPLEIVSTVTIIMIGSIVLNLILSYTGLNIPSITV